MRSVSHSRSGGGQCEEESRGKRPLSWWSTSPQMSKAKPGNTRVSTSGCTGRFLGPTSELLHQNIWEQNTGNWMLNKFLVWFLNSTAHRSEQLGILPWTLPFKELSSSRALHRARCPRGQDNKFNSTQCSPSTQLPTIRPWSWFPRPWILCLNDTETNTKAWMDLFP